MSRPQRTCRGKRRFRDQQEATHALHHIVSRGFVRQKTPKRAYECPRCKGWHLTSQDDNGGRR